VARRALITGVAGQDGSLLGELLLEQGYEVCGVVRSLARPLPNLDAVRERLELVEVDLASAGAVAAVLRDLAPQEVYNLAAISHVPRSWEQPVETAELGAVAVAALLESIRRAAPGARFFQASSAEIFGEPAEEPQTETTPIAPLTPYGAAKAFGHFLTRSYRLRYGLHASSGILFNHESPRRPVDFVTRKVARGAASVRLGLADELLLGSLEARRDWAWAPDVVCGMWLMLQADEPDDYVLATGETHSVAELAETAFARVGLDWREHVRVDPVLERGRTDARQLVGDPTKARERLGWTPTVGFEELVGRLVDAELAALTGPSAGTPSA